MRVLIVRLSSMGDVVHTMPALTDAIRARPEIRFDWAVDEAFADIPAWHSHVRKVFPVGLRRWRNELTDGQGRAEVRTIIKDLRLERYDAIVDLQGEFKSAFVARLAKGPRYGYDGASARERGAHLAYNTSYKVPKGAHSMSRMRRLLSQSLDYAYDENAIDYGIVRDRLPAPRVKMQRPYVVFIHSTSWESKNWPEEYWCSLRERVSGAGFSIVLPWGSEAERERSRNIANDDTNAVVLPPLPISEKASIIAGAAATVGLDTGLSHIAAALAVPSITLYGATDPNLCGTIGERQLQIKSDFECIGCHETVCSFQKTDFKPACFENLGPSTVWQRLEQLLSASLQSQRVYQLA